MECWHKEPQKISDSFGIFMNHERGHESWLFEVHCTYLLIPQSNLFDNSLNYLKCQHKVEVFFSNGVW